MSEETVMEPTESNINPNIVMLEELVSEKIAALLESDSPADKNKAYAYKEMYNYFSVAMQFLNVAIDLSRSIKLLSGIAN